MKAIRAAVVMLTAFLCVVMIVHGASYEDDFTTPHDYLADGVEGTLWDGLLYNFTNGNAEVTIVDAGIRNPDALTFQSTDGNWEKSDADGLLLYRIVSGDFEVTVRIVSMNVVSWHDGGIMARVANPDDAGPGEDWIVVKHFPHLGQNALRSTDNGVGSDYAVAGLYPWLRLQRIGNVFTAYRSHDGEEWAAIASIERKDMHGLPLQVGLWHATFGSNQGTAVFDNFVLRQPEIWVGGSSGSWSEISNWSNGQLPDLSGGWAMFNIVGNCITALDGQRKMGSLILSGSASSVNVIESGTDAPESQLILAKKPEDGYEWPHIDVRGGTHLITAPVVLSNDTSMIVADSATLALNEELWGSGSLIKKGFGTLALSSTNSYAGTTKIESGAIKTDRIPAGTKAWYRFDDANNIGIDSSGLGNHLTTVGSPAYTAAGAWGGSVYLDGNSYFTRTIFPLGVPVGGSPYTIALWARDDGSPVSGGFCGWGQNSKNKCNNFRYQGNGELINYWYGNDWWVKEISPNPKDGNWHHLAVTWDGSQQTMYVDGIQVATSLHSGLDAQPINFVVGKTTADVALKGWLDEVLIADRAFEQAEIAALASRAQQRSLLPGSSVLEIDSCAALYMSGEEQILAGLAGSGVVFNNSSQSALISINNDADSIFNGSFCGEIEIVKNGSGVLTLGGAQLSRSVSVESGTLQLNRSLLPGLLAQSRAWYDASDMASIVTNELGVVTNWCNKGSGGAALDAVLIDETAVPMVEQGGFNGRSVLKLEDTKGLQSAGNTEISGGQDRTLFVVGCRSSSSHNMFFAHIGEGVESKAFGFASREDLFFGYVWGSGNDVMLNPHKVGSYKLYDFMLKNKFGTVTTMDGSTVGGGERGMAVNTTDTPLYLGSRFNEKCSGKIAEVILFDRALTEAERAMVQAYLLAKWFSSDSYSIYGGEYRVAEGAVIDLDGTAQTLSGLSGSGVVTNGTLQVAGELAPGGAGEVGTLTLATATSLLGGALVVDIGEDGNCDLLAVQGNLDLAGATLVVRDPSRLVTGRGYQIISCDGVLSGTLAPQFTGSSNWKVRYDRVNGKVVLASYGTVMMIK